jgi:creatinine amidohydrolase
MLQECTLAALRACPPQVLVLPLGATEPHNLHLPYGMDTIEATAIGQHLCRLAWEAGAKVMLLPAIPYGTETNLAAFPLAMNLNPSTLLAVLNDLVRSIEASGVRKVVLLNSHGGNDLKPVLRELYGQTRVHLFLCNWYQVVQDRYDEFFAVRDDHAGEMETSLALALVPHWVARDAAGGLAADSGAVRSSRFEAVRRGWISITRPWHLFTAHSGSGDPHGATAAKGTRVVDLLAERLVPFLVELAAAEIDENFPY